MSSCIIWTEGSGEKNFSGLPLIADHRRFKDCKLGIIVSSLRALKIFLHKIQKFKRLPDYIIIEGPLAGGHLGFGMDWFRYKLKDIVKEISCFCKKNSLKISLIAAGGVFSGSEAVDMVQSGASGVQLATRFTITEECGLPTRIKQEYIKASESDVYVSCLLQVIPCVSYDKAQL